jgi:hypothetical protein
MLALFALRKRERHSLKSKKISKILLIVFLLGLEKIAVNGRVFNVTTKLVMF